MNKSQRILRKPEVLELIGISSSTLERLEKRNKFPKRKLLSARSIGWLECEVMSWISESNQRLHDESKEQASSVGDVIKSGTHRMASGGVR